MNQPLRTFRPALGPLFRLAAIFLVAVVAAVWCVLSLLGVRLSAPSPTVVGIMGAGFLLSLSGAVFPVHVYAEGVRGYNYWGTYHFVRWDEMTDIRPGSLPGLRYVRIVAGHGGPELWVSLFLRGMPSFTALVREHAGADHRLTQFLERSTSA
jgi:hypothetical protein